MRNRGQGRGALLVLALLCSLDLSLGRRTAALTAAGPPVPASLPAAPPRIDDPSKRVTVVTTASLPWMTGTAVNPLLRAAYLTVDREAGAVTLLVPWVEPEDQKKIFPKNLTFATQEEQRAYVLKWVAESAGMGAAARKLRVDFYPGRYLSGYGSIFALGPVVGPLISAQGQGNTDICILEEPEHLCWYRCPEVGWMDAFDWVVGVAHTNYVEYARKERGSVAVPLVWGLNQLMYRAYCHKTVKLSATLQQYAPRKETVANVHGVRQAFFDAGRAADLRGFPGSRPALEARGGGGREPVVQCYFVSKQLWAKGYDLLFELLDHHHQRQGVGVAMDLYGNGPDHAAIGARASKAAAPIRMMGYADHADLGAYRIFINPSVTEVLCTTVAEALAMGKWVVIPKHPSNAFFERFPTALVYGSKDEFVHCLQWALNNEPPPLLPEVRGDLTWGAAMLRLGEAAAPAPGDRTLGRGPFDRACEAFYKWLGQGPKGDLIRLLTGGGVVAGQNAFVKKQRREQQAAAVAAAAAAAAASDTTTAA